MTDDHPHCDCPDGRLSVAREAIEALVDQIAVLLSMTAKPPAEARVAMQYGAAVLEVLQPEWGE
jgi:hypothetical protein